MKLMPRRFAASLVLAGSLAMPFAFSTPSSASLAHTSAFCKTLTSVKPPSLPKTYNVTAYRTWAKEFAPFYATLANEAPTNGAKQVLLAVATVLKGEESVRNTTALRAYVVGHQAAWVKGAKELVAAIMSCASSMLVSLG